MAIVKHKVLSEYGTDAILKPFIQDMKKLVSHYGYAFLIMIGWFGTSFEFGWWPCYSHGIIQKKGAAESKFLPCAPAQGVAKVIFFFFFFYCVLSSTQKLPDLKV